MHKFLIIALLSGTACTATQAADLDAPVPVVDEAAIGYAMAPAWQGAYLGLQLGAVWGAVDDTYPPNPAAETDTDLAGANVGIYGGWNAQFDGVVLGIDADLNYSNASASGTNPALETSTLDIDWSGAVRGRAGFAADNLLFYVAGGLAAANASLEINGAAPIASAEDILLGWTAGAGVELAFNENWVGRLDYRYSDFGDLEYTVPLGGDGSVHVTTHTLSLGIAYKF